MGSGHAGLVLLLASASTPEQSLSSTIGIATDLPRLLQRRHFRVSPGRSEPRSKNPGFQSPIPGATLAMDLDTDRVETPEQEENDKPVARMDMSQAGTCTRRQPGSRISLALGMRG
jgi:hypothetical protein